MTAMSPSVRVLVADDHPVVRSGLCAMLAREPDLLVVAEAEDGAGTLAAVRTHRPDVLLLDLRMPGLDGHAVLAELRSARSPVRTLVLSTFNTEEDVHRAVQAGARGFLLKDAPRQQIVDAVRQVHAGGTCLPPALVARFIQGNAAARLTPRELEVLRGVAAGGLNKEIGERLQIAEVTVKSHLNSIYAKLGVDGRTRAVRVALERGLLRLP